MDRQTKYSCASVLTESLKDFSQGFLNLRNQMIIVKDITFIFITRLYRLLNFGKQDRN